MKRIFLILTAVFTFTTVSNAQNGMTGEILNSLDRAIEILEEKQQDFEDGKKEFQRLIDSISTVVNDLNQQKIEALRNGIKDIDSSISDTKNRLKCIDMLRDEYDRNRNKDFMISDGENSVEGKSISEGFLITSICGNDTVIVEANKDGSCKTIVKNGKENVVVRSGAIEQKDVNSHSIFPRRYEFRVKRVNFDSHLGGIFFGINALRAPEGEEVPDFMNLNESRSLVFDVTFMSFDIPFCNNFGMAAGFNFEFNHYSFSTQKPFDLKVADSHVYADYLSPISDSFKRHNLRLIYFNVPIIMEYEIPTRSGELYVQAGIKGGVRIGSRTKQVYEVNGSRKKNCDRSSFETQLLRYSFIGGLGLGAWQIYGEYSPVPLFKEGHGPELYPFALGIKLSF